MLQRDRFATVLLFVFFASTLLLMASGGIASVVPEWLAWIGLLGWLACILGVMHLAARRGGWPRAVVEGALATVIVLVTVAGIRSAGSVREDLRMRHAGVAAFEAASHHDVLEVVRYARFGSCAVMTVAWRDDTAFIGLARTGSGWKLRGVITEYADEDDVSDADTCRDAVAGASPLPK